MRVGSIAELWVYPVKSMRGKRVASVALDPEGICGDRRFAFESSNAPTGKPLLTGRERAAILLYSPHTTNGEHQVRTPDGESFPLHSIELAQTFLAEKNNNASSFQLLASPEKPLTDVRALSLISTATLEAVSEEMGHSIDPQRFRSNIVLQFDDEVAFSEEAWNGRVLRFGDKQAAAEITLLERIPRCRMISLDPATAKPNHAILKHLAREHAGRLGVYGATHQAGALEEGQSAYLL